MTLPPETDTQPPKIDRASVRQLLSLFRPYPRDVVLLVFAILVGVLLGIVPPFLLEVIIDRGIEKNNLAVVEQYSILTISITLVAAAMTLLYGYLGVVLGQKVMVRMRDDLFKHLQGMSLRFFTSTRTGDIQTRLISDIAGIQNVVCNSFVDALSNIAIVITALVAMIGMDWRLTLLSLALIPVFAVIGKWVGDFARKVRTGTQEQTSELNSMMEENLSVSGALLGKTIGREDVLFSKFDVENEKLAHWQIKSSVLQYVFFGMFRIITQVIPVMIYWLAAWLIFHGDKSITVGKLVAFTMVQTRMFFPLTGIMSLQVEILSSFALFDRIYQYLDMPHDITDSPGAKALPPGEAKGAVRFENVGFQYEQDSEEWTLKDISFEAEPGQLVALVGPSGAGKTTVTYLIPRLYDVDAGRVLIDGIDVRDIRMEDLKQAVGMVTQETYLIHTTIAENLRIAKPEALLEELVEACKAAAIHDHIASLPEGYDTVVGERGYKLSGGEKQRLAIARAILKNPRILILDEATSALDTRSERLIQRSLNSLMKGRTTFAIAHRLSTILSADLILVIQDGRVVERGRHEELMALNGLYGKLYNEQFQSEREHARHA